MEDARESEECGFEVKEENKNSIVRMCGRITQDITWLPYRIFQMVCYESLELTV